MKDRPLLFTNTLDLLPNGDFYFTDSSWKFGRAEHSIDVRPMITPVCPTSEAVSELDNNGCHVA